MVPCHVHTFTTFTLLRYYTSTLFHLHHATRAPFHLNPPTRIPFCPSTMLPRSMLTPCILLPFCTATLPCSPVYPFTRIHFCPLTFTFLPVYPSAFPKFDLCAHSYLTFVCAPIMTTLPSFYTYTLVSPLYPIYIVASPPWYLFYPSTCIPLYPSTILPVNPSTLSTLTTLPPLYPVTCLPCYSSTLVRPDPPALRKPCPPSYPSTLISVHASTRLHCYPFNVHPYTRLPVPLVLPFSYPTLYPFYPYTVLPSPPYIRPPSPRECSLLYPYTTLPFYPSTLSITTLLRFYPVTPLLPCKGHPPTVPTYPSTRLPHLAS